MKALLGMAALAGYANSHAGWKFYISSTNQESDLNQAGFEALTWVQVKGVGSFGETGDNTNILTYDDWDTDVIQKAKGMTDAGSPEVECRRIPTDAGQVAMRAAALTNLNYAFKTEANDEPDTNPLSTPTIRYNRGLVSGPREPNGRNEDFDLEVFTLGLNQRQIKVNPVAG